MKFILGFQYIILKNMKQIVSVNNFHLYVINFLFNNINNY